MVISHNIPALNTYKALGISGKSSNKSMEKLSSGYKINRAGDDAAGLSISEKMRSQIRGLKQASTNSSNGISMIQTAEGALNEQHAILQRMRELAVQSATDTNAGEDREALQSELEQLTCEINRIGNTTEFNGMKILNGDKELAYPSATGVKASVDVKGLTFKAHEGKNGNDLKIAVVKDESATKSVSYDESTKTITFTMKGADYTLANVKALITGNEKVNSLLDANATAGTGNLDGDAAAAALTGGSVTLGDATDKSVYFHVGANKDQVISTSFNDMRAKSLGLTITADVVATGNVVSIGGYGTSGIDGERHTAYFTSSLKVNNGTDTNATERALDITTRKGANTAIEVIDGAMKAVSQERSKYGAIQNRLEYTINNLNTTAENMQSAESTIRDVDMANEMMELTKNNILQQAAQAMLVQANQRPQQALQLLQ